MKHLIHTSCRYGVRGKSKLCDRCRQPITLYATGRILEYTHGPHEGGFMSLDAPAFIDNPPAEEANAVECRPPQPSGDPRDFYRILGVAPDATGVEIQAGYRREAMKYHPDKVVHTGLDRELAELFMRDLTKVADVLRSPERRAAYDRWRRWRDRQAETGGLVFTPEGFRVHIYRGKA